MAARQSSSGGRPLTEHPLDLVPPEEPRPILGMLIEARHRAVGITSRFDISVQVGAGPILSPSRDAPFGNDDLASPVYLDSEIAIFLVCFTASGDFGNVTVKTPIPVSARTASGSIV